MSRRRSVFPPYVHLTDRVANFPDLICHSFLFPNDVDAGFQVATHVVVNISGFSDGFDAFQMACASLNRFSTTSAFWVAHSSNCNDLNRHLRYGMRSCQIGA